MKESTEITLGYTALGITAGMFLFPWIFVPLTRYNVTELGNPLWAWIVFGIVAVPGLIGFLVGRARASSAAA
jgi:hypothetical protein